MNAKTFTIFTALLLLALLIRIPNLPKDFANDEQDMAMNSLYYVKEGTPKVLDWDKQDQVTKADLIHKPNHSYLSTVWPYALFSYLPFSWETNNQGNHVIYTGGKYDSYLQIPVIPARYQSGEYVYR